MTNLSLDPPLAPAPPEMFAYEVVRFSRNPVLGYDCDLAGNQSGEYVTLADYKALTARLDAVTGERDGAEKACEILRKNFDRVTNENTQLHTALVGSGVSLDYFRAELATLREQVAELRDAGRKFLNAHGWDTDANEFYHVDPYDAAEFDAALAQGGGVATEEQVSE